MMWGPTGPLLAQIAEENREQAESKLYGPCRCQCHCKGKAEVVWNRGTTYLPVCQECNDDLEVGSWL